MAACTKVILLLSFTFHQTICDEFYNFMNNDDGSQSQSSYSSYDQNLLAEYEDLVQEESKLDYDEGVDANYDDDHVPEERTFTKHSSGRSDCIIKYETVSVVKQVPSFSKHCHKVEDTKCKTIFKNSFQTKMETQCVAAFDTRKVNSHKQS